jgi:dipeptidyl aminopeptidase/acylaminoacyl peptidase
MSDLEERFRSLGRVSSPNLWTEIEGREPGWTPPEPSAGRRWLVGAVAFVVAAAGFAFAATAFRDDNGPPPTSLVTNGKIALVGFGQIVTVDPDGTHPTRLTDLPTNQGHPAWSLDGGRIAFDVQGSDGRMQIYVMDADGSNLKRLTEGPGWNALPDWSPDGTKIAFVSNRDGNDEIYVMNADGSGQTRLTDDPEEDLVPDWSADGSRIAFQSNRTANNEIYVMNADGSGVTNLTDAPSSGEFDPAWSPDGGRIAFASDRDGNPEIYLMSSDGSGVTRLTDDPSHDWSPAWSPDSSKIAFESDRDGPVGVYVMNSDGTEVRKLTSTSKEACCPAWQPVQTSAVSLTPTPTPSETSPPSIGSSPSAEMQIVSPPSSASSLLYAFGSVWVAWFDGSGANVTRIDAATNEIVATIPIEDSPSWESGGGGIAEGLGSIWVTGFSRQGGVLQRIDPSTNRMVSAIQLGKDFTALAADVAVEENGVWVASMPLDKDGASFLYRVDPATDQVVTEIPLEYEYERQVIGVNGTIVLRQLHWHDDGSGPYTIFTSIDASTNAVNASSSEDAFWGMWMWDEQLWAGVGSFSTGNQLVRVDPITLSAIGEAVSIDAERIGSFEAGGGGIWFVTASGVNHWQQPVKVDRFNLETGRIDVSETVPAAGGQDIAVGGGAIWFLKDGNVLRFDLT